MNDNDDDVDKGKKTKNFSKELTSSMVCINMTLYDR